MMERHSTPGLSATPSDVRCDGLPRRPCARLPWPPAPTTCGPFLFREQPCRLCWQSRAACLAPSRRSRVYVCPQCLPRSAPTTKCSCVESACCCRQVDVAATHMPHTARLSQEFDADDAPSSASVRPTSTQPARFNLAAVLRNRATARSTRCQSRYRHHWTIC